MVILGQKTSGGLAPLALDDNGRLLVTADGPSEPEAITLTASAGGASAWTDISGLRYPITVTIVPGVGGTASIETATTVAEPAAADIEADVKVTGIAAIESFSLDSRANWLRLAAVTAAATARLVQWGRQ